MKEKEKSFNRGLKIFSDSKLSETTERVELRHNYFYLSTKKITLMGMLLALNIILTIFSRYVLGMVPILGFFVIELSFVSILTFALINNFFYSFIFLEITIWFRLILGSEPIGLLAMNLADGFFLLFFCLGNFLLKKIVLQDYNHKNFKKFFVYELFMLTIITLATSIVALLINYSFLLSMYFPLWGKKQILPLLPIIFGLNIGKYVVNCAFYLITFKPSIILSKHYHF